MEEVALALLTYSGGTPSLLVSTPSVGPSFGLHRYMQLAVPAPGGVVRFHVHPDLPEIRYQRGETAEFKGGHQLNTTG